MPTTARLFPGIVLLSLIALPSCVTRESTTILDVLYSPVATFSGWVNGDSLHLPGNLRHPNTCTASVNSVDMCFYSEDFSSVGTTWTGSMLKLSLFVCGSDTAISNGGVLFRYSAFTNGNLTFQISREDTLRPIANPISLHVVQCSRHKGDEIRIEDISARPRLLTTGGIRGFDATFSQGTISGTIQ